MTAAKLALVFPGLIAALLAGAHGLGAETLRPLETEDVATLPSGAVEGQAALAYLGNFQSPARDLHGSLLRLPILAIQYGVGEHAEIQLRAPLASRFEPDGEPARTEFGDVTVATKLRLFGGRGPVGPGLGVRVLVKLPNLSDSSGIGTDETDVTLELLGEARALGFRVVGSVGYAVVGDPANAASQNDKMALGLGVLLPFGPLDLVADVHGVALGESSGPDSWTALGGMALGVGPARIDGAIGLASFAGRRSFLVTAGASLTLRLRQR